MRRNLLPLIQAPADLSDLTFAELDQLAAEVRDRLTEVVNLNGGHLASNLGVVELTLALHHTFELPTDRLVWDVSHQTYAHKILTGRNELFGRLRQYEGCCGFASKEESPFDLFDAGHAGTSISAALGLSSAHRVLGRPGRDVAVIGDASIAIGMVFEAMNHAGDLGENLLVILNDNRMSIDHSVGAMSKYLNRLRSGSLYRGLKRDVSVLLPRIPWVGRPVEEALESLKELVHNAFVPGQIFEDLGFRYFGPVSGHDLRELVPTLERVKKIQGPVLLHVMTNKGHGFAPAQADPIKYHASKSFLPSTRAKEPPTIPPAVEPKRETYSDAFSRALIELAEEDSLIHAVTAAMPGGTGLNRFQARFPDRYYDVGIAEQHGTTYSSGLSLGGLKPVFAVYSTFLQRGYDQVIHDVCLQDNRVVFALDRAGLVEDGPTHHGVFDIAYLRPIPNLSLAAPADADDLREMLALAFDHDHSSAIRYAKTSLPQIERKRPREPVTWGRAEILREPARLTILAYGSLVETAVLAADQLEREQGVSVGVVNMRFAKPLDVELLRELASSDRLIFTLEEHAVVGGFGSQVLEAVHREGLEFERIELWGIPDRFISFGRRELLLRDLRLDASGIRERLESYSESSVLGSPW